MIPGVNSGIAHTNSIEGNLNFIGVFFQKQSVRADKQINKQKEIAEGTYTHIIASTSTQLHMANASSSQESHAVTKKSKEEHKKQIMINTSRVTYQ